MIQKEWSTFENSVNKWKKAHTVILTKEIQSVEKHHLLYPVLTNEDATAASSSSLSPRS